MFQSAAATSRSVQQLPSAEQHSHANAPTGSTGNEIVGPSLLLEPWQLKGKIMRSVNARLNFVHYVMECMS